VVFVVAATTLQTNATHILAAVLVKNICRHLAGVLAPIAVVFNVIGFLHSSSTAVAGGRFASKLNPGNTLGVRSCVAA